MFHTKTVFVIGAGASHEVGLPLGSTLKHKVSELLDFVHESQVCDKGDKDLFEIIRRGRETWNQIHYLNEFSAKAKRMASALRTNTVTSIDAFLENYSSDTDFQLYGKLGIIKSILAAEHESALRQRAANVSDFEPTKVAEKWYPKFAAMLLNGHTPETLDQIFDNVTIITFNYDRCIERYLEQAFREHLIENDPEYIHTLLKKLRIIRPYGSLGPLPWQDRQGLPYGATTADYLALSQRIQTFSEPRTDGIKDEIRQVIEEANVLVFMGFSFASTNMEFFRVENQNVKKVYATGFGMSDAEITATQENLAQILKQPGHVSAVFEKSQCWEFLRDYGSLFTTRH